MAPELDVRGQMTWWVQLWWLQSQWLSPRKSTLRCSFYHSFSSFSQTLAQIWFESLKMLLILRGSCIPLSQIFHQTHLRRIPILIHHFPSFFSGSAQRAPLVPLSMTFVYLVKLRETWRFLRRPSQSSGLPHRRIEGELSSWLLLLLLYVVVKVNYCQQQRLILLVVF